MAPKYVSMSYRKFARSFLKKAGYFLMTGYTCCALFYHALPHRPFPLFPWDLYSTGFTTVSASDIIVRSLEPDRKLDHPVFLADLKQEYHRDWDLCPGKAINALTNALLAGDGITQAEKKKLVENFLIDYPHAHYDLVLMKYAPVAVLNSGHYDRPSDFSYRVIASFVK